MGQIRVSFGGTSHLKLNNMNKKEAIVFIAKHYGVMPIEQLCAAVGMKRATVSQYARRMRTLGIVIAQYPKVITTSDYKEAVAQLLAEQNV